MRPLVWLLRLLVFALLFALALNNQHDVALKTMFGHEWRAPMIFIVLVAFVLGCAAGVAGMLPSWWRRRLPPTLPSPPHGAALRAAGTLPSGSGVPEAQPLDHPPRDGL